ncbi:hypothetical protein [Salinicola endophyticus]|uniref:Uncharacterized protein n=1 Tax=Salinicola endophyticus TaxID=1949083 RepID=A0AB74UBY1_9GAMM
MALDPKRVVLGWPNYIEDATLSGGAYVDTLPLANVQERRFSVVAKTAGLDPAATQFTLVLPQRRPVSVVAIPAHNMSAAAQVRVRVYRDQAGADLVWDSGRRDVWPIVYGIGDVVWGNSNFWNRRMQEETRRSYTPLLTVFLDDQQIASRIHVELFDESNLDGALTLGRVFVSDAWQPEYNMSLGPQYGYDSGTEVTTARDASRTEYFERFTPKRTVQLSLDWLSENEAFLRIHRLQRTQDIVGEVLFVQSVKPSPIEFARSMIARQASLDPLVHPYQTTYTNQLNLQEIL